LFRTVIILGVNGCDVDCFCAKSCHAVFLELHASWRSYDFSLTRTVFKNRKVKPPIGRRKETSAVLQLGARRYNITTTISTYIFEQQAHQCTLESGVLHLPPPFYRRHKTTYPLFLRETCFQTQHESRTDLE